jgi:RNA polymerase sigma-70 factor (ECF subfamily)
VNALSGKLVEHFFRHESANLIAVLSRAFGVGRIELVEDMVQAAMLEAMQVWKHKGVPDNPAGWIHRVARNRILDVLRREKVHQQALALSGQTIESSELLLDQWLQEEQIPDSLLRMMFVCCHGVLDRPSQIALTLNILGGFSCGEIARGMLQNKEAVKKRIQRAKKKLAMEQVNFDLPVRGVLQDRLTVVHEVLYLMFNEGYSASHGNDPVRDELCEEAARLCHLLCQSDLGNPTTFSLLALMLFHAARLDSRTDAEGSAILLEHQDRSSWDRKLIQVAEHWLHRSGAGAVSVYHLEAAIAMQHCRASSLESTNWAVIVGFYDRLILIKDSPVYRLNRAIAQAQDGNTESALEELSQISECAEMKNYFLLDCARARLHELRGDLAEATKLYEATLDRELANHERIFLKKRIDQLKSN